MANSWIESPKTKAGNGRSRGTYKARLRLPDGKITSRSFTKRADAKQWLSDEESKLALGTFVDPKLGKVTYGEWLELFRSGEVGLRRTTLALQDATCRNYLKPTFGALPLSAVTHMRVQAWVAGMVRAGLAPTTVRNYYQTFAKSMAGAVDAGLIPQSPCRNIRLPRVEREEMRFLSPDDVAALARAIDARFSTLVVCAAYSGLRIGELAGLRGKYFDSMRATIEVVEIASEVRGELAYGPPKTRAGRRRVPIPREVSDLLVEHMARYKISGADDHVFCGSHGGTLRSRAWRSRFFKPAVERAKVAPLRIHDLRHTAVAIWIAAGVSPKEIAVRAGHTSVSTVLDRYGHLLPSSDADFGERVGKMYVAPDLTTGELIKVSFPR